eukprot:7920849-Pyramimonas_sp.AAC.1
MGLEVGRLGPDSADAFSRSSLTTDAKLCVMILFENSLPPDTKETPHGGNMTLLPFWGLDLDDDILWTIIHICEDVLHGGISGELILSI